MSNPLGKYSILVADADRLLANVLKMLLGEMGFSKVSITNSGAEARAFLQKKRFDFLITEWNMPDIDGIELIKQIRHDTIASNPLLPIVMLTGRAEQSDVTIARDTGINEFVVKPFTAKTIYARLERLIEKPRNFIAASTFIGPDRRYRESPPPGVVNRRMLAVGPIPHSLKETKGNLINSRPRIWAPDFSLKQKLGPLQRLDILITSDILKAAQKSIDAVTADSLKWIKQDLADLKSLHQRMLTGELIDTFTGELQNCALAISSRAGTFGYRRAAEVAYGLYLFYRNKCLASNATHQVIVQKYIDVLQVIFSSNLQGTGGEAGEKIALELQNLVLKYAP